MNFRFTLISGGGGGVKSLYKSNCKDRGVVC